MYQELDVDNYVLYLKHLYLTPEAAEAARAGGVVLVEAGDRGEVGGGGDHRAAVHRSHPAPRLLLLLGLQLQPQVAHEALRRVPGVGGRAVNTLLKHWTDYKILSVFCDCVHFN